jgi:hypothetical protein
MLGVGLAGWFCITVPAVVWLVECFAACRARRTGRHVDNVFAMGDELLGEQVAEPSGGLDRPAAASIAQRRPSPFSCEAQSISFLV